MSDVGQGRQISDFHNYIATVANLVVIGARFLLAHSAKVGHFEVRGQLEIVPNVVEAAPEGWGVHGQDQRREPRGLRAADQALGDLPVLEQFGTASLGKQPVKLG